MDIKQRNKDLKKLMTGLFPTKQVSVTGATGTATGWANINIEVPKTDECQCIKMFGAGRDRQPGICPDCKDLREKSYNKAQNAISNSNIEFYSYTDDMNLEHKEYILQVNLTSQY